VHLKIIAHTSYLSSGPKELPCPVSSTSSMGEWQW
jgi:hypothetical protein